MAWLDCYTATHTTHGPNALLYAGSARPRHKHQGYSPTSSSPRAEASGTYPSGRLGTADHRVLSTRRTQLRMLVHTRIPAPPVNISACIGSLPRSARGAASRTSASGAAAAQPRSLWQPADAQSSGPPRTKSSTAGAGVTALCIVGTMHVPSSNALCVRTSVGIIGSLALLSSIPPLKGITSGAFPAHTCGFVFGYSACHSWTVTQRHVPRRPERIPEHRGAASTSRTPRMLPEFVSSNGHNAADIYVGSRSCWEALPHPEPDTRSYAQRGTYTYHS